jgi:hypothetical protein
MKAGLVQDDSCLPSSSNQHSNPLVFRSPLFKYLSADCQYIVYLNDEVQGTFASLQVAYEEEMPCTFLTP